MNAQPQRPHEYFIDRLLKLKKDDNRAALAILRRGLVDFGSDFSIYSVVGNALPKEASQFDIDKYLLTACLFASPPSDTEGDASVGTAARNLRAKLSVGQESLDKRFSALLNSEDEDLPTRLRQMISLFKSKEVPLNYATLLSDLLKWRTDSRYVQKRWAKDYWVGKEEVNPKGSAQENELTSDEAIAN
ncbi:MAG: type I-E CRISPR-associated protein Cse2/CasB [Candidatus Kapaibacterium sp.]